MKEKHRNAFGEPFSLWFYDNIEYSIMIMGYENITTTKDRYLPYVDFYKNYEYISDTLRGFAAESIILGKLLDD